MSGRRFGRSEFPFKLLINFHRSYGLSSPVFIRRLRGQGATPPFRFSRASRISRIVNKIRRAILPRKRAGARPAISILSDYGNFPPFPVCVSQHTGPTGMIPNILVNGEG